MDGSSLSEIRFVRIKGIGDESGGSSRGYELDAIGAIHFSSPAAYAILGDSDADGDVDLADYANMTNCVFGPNSGMGSGCECYDSDGDVDLRDYAELQLVFAGS